MTTFKLYDPFDVSCPMTGEDLERIRNSRHKTMGTPQKQKTPLDLPKSLSYCSHVEEVGYSLNPIYKRCSNRVEVRDQKHGYLCRFHLSNQELGYEGRAQEKLGHERNWEDANALRDRMGIEVDRARTGTAFMNDGDVVIDWWKYHHFGWWREGYDPGLDPETFELNPDLFE